MTRQTTTLSPQAAPALTSRVARGFLLHHRLCPVETGPDGPLTVCITSASLLSGLDDLSVAYDRRIVTRDVSEQELDALIARLTTADEDLKVPKGETEDEAPQSIRDLANQPPVVRYVSLLIRDACDAGASDIHLESTRAGLESRCRVDGVLVPALEAPSRMDRAIVSRIKLLAGLDIAERRRPQDGRIRVRLDDHELHLRVSTVPTVFGESVVLRLLERGGDAIALDDLGLSGKLLDDIRDLAQRSHGMTLVTGPTGSGKTTTLYAALGLRAAAAEKIITIEDPVERTLDGITQVPVHTQTGVTFASMLRSILRQDPDVILVGEMRDSETAELAVQAALTGHVVFSTLHTNDAIGAIPRLLDLRVAPYLIVATVEGVLAQRLVRRTCDACREVYAPSAESIAALRADHDGDVQFTRGRGCPACRNTGYKGRTGLFELLVLSDELREAIGAQPTRQRLRELATTAGMGTLRKDGWAKVVAGVTTVEEVLRVTQA